MKQALAITLTGLQGLGSTDDNRERPVDRLAAIAASQIRTADRAAREVFMAGLGKDLIAYKLANRADCHADAVSRLAEALKWTPGLNPWQRSSIATWAIREWAIDFCESCSGAGNTPAHDQNGLEGAQPMQTCPTCSGTGKRRYSDSERKQAMGEPYAKEMDRAHALISEAESTATRTTAQLLERWK